MHATCARTVTGVVPQKPKPLRRHEKRDHDLKLCDAEVSREPLLVEPVLPALAAVGARRVSHCTVLAKAYDDLVRVACERAVRAEVLHLLRCLLLVVHPSRHAAGITVGAMCQTRKTAAEKAHAAVLRVGIVVAI